jgi:hypothetical protein
MNAMQLCDPLIFGASIGAFLGCDEHSNVDVRVFDGWELDLSEQVETVGRGAYADGLEVGGAEASKIRVGYGGYRTEVFWFMFWAGQGVFV